MSDDLMEIGVVLRELSALAAGLAEQHGPLAPTTEWRGEQALTADLLLAAGQLAHSLGEPLSACPFAPGDRRGSPWQHGWLQAEGRARTDAGTFDHTPEFYAELAETEGRSKAAVDPVVEILGGYDELPEKPPPLEIVPVGYDPATWAQRLRWEEMTPEERRAVWLDAAARFAAAVESFRSSFEAAGEALSGLMRQLGDALRGAAPGAEPKARQQERALLAQRRREQRASSRWRQPPGRGARR